MAGPGAIMAEKMPRVRNLTSCYYSGYVLRRLFGEQEFCAEGKGLEAVIGDFFGERKLEISLERPW